MHFYWILSRVIANVSSIRGYIASESASVMLVKSTAWNILVLDDFNNTYNHLLMAAATWLVTTKNGESGSEFPRASPVSLQNWTIKIPATQHLLPRKSRMQSYALYVDFAASATNELAILRTVYHLGLNVRSMW